MSKERNHLITVITYNDEIHVHSTTIEEHKNEEIFMRNFDVYYPAKDFFEEIFSYIEKDVICGFIFVMGNTLKPSFMDSYPFRMDCRNYSQVNNFPIAFTSFQCMEMHAAVLSSKIPINELKNGEIITVIAKICATNRDLISCLPMQYENGNFQILPTFVYFNPDLKSKEFLEDCLRTRLTPSKHYIIVYPDEESHERYRKAFGPLNPLFIDRWDKAFTAKMNMEFSLNKLGIIKSFNFAVNICPVIHKVIYEDKILFTSEEKFPFKKFADIVVDSKNAVKHEIHQKDWTAVIFSREISLKSFTSSKATVSLEVDEDLCFRFDVQPLL